jgi:hypothetical protein
MPTYRTTGPWGAGTGSNLSAAQVDTNFYELRSDLDDVIASPPTAVSIASIEIIGTSMYFHMSNGDTIGPLEIPTLKFRWRGDWTATTAYLALDAFKVDTVGLFIVLKDHTSDLTFDPAATSGGEPLYHELFGFSGLSGAFFADLVDVGLSGLAAGDFIRWDGTASMWVNQTPTQVTAALIPFVGDTGAGGTKGVVPAPAIGDAGKFLKGDGTWADVVATGIADNAVTNAKLADMATARFKGRTTAGTGDPEDLTATQATALLNPFTGDTGSGGLKGIVPAPAAGDATKFLRGDSTWQTVTGGGSSTLAGDTDVSIASPANDDFLQFRTSDSLWHNRTPTQATAALIGFVGDTGSGGTKGLVPAPAAGDAAAGKFLKADGSWAAPAGGGSSDRGLFAENMSALPTQTSTGLNSWANQPTGATVANDPDGITVTETTQSSAHNLGLITKAAPSTPYSFTALITHTGLHTNFGAIEFGWWNGLTGGSAKEHVFHHSFADGLGVNKWTGFNAASATLDFGLVTGYPDMLWYKIRNDGTNIYFYISQAGPPRWIQVFSIALASAFLGASGYTNIVFGVSSHSQQAWASLHSFTQGTS